MHKLFLIIIMLFALLCHPMITFANEYFRIEISGIEGDMYKNAQARLKLEEDKSNVLVSIADMDAFLKRVPDIIRRSLEPYGYFNASVTPVKIKRDDAIMIASFHVDTAQPLKLSSVKVKILGNGESDPALRKLIQQFPIKTGMIFQSEQYENAKESLFQTANDQGYIKSYFEKSEVRVDLKRNQADVDIILQTLDKYYFGDVSYDSSPFAPSFLKRFHSFKNDAHFSSKKLYKFQQNLSNSGYFQQVDATPDFEHMENYRIPVHVALTAPKSQRYDFGLGYGTFTGPRLSAGVNFRRITDTGQHFNAELKISSVLTGLAAKYFIPGNDPLSDTYVIGASYQKFSPKNGQSYSKNISAGYLNKSSHWHKNLTLNYLSERYAIQDEASKSSELLYPSLNLSYIKADDLTNPHSGMSLNLTLQGASKNLLSSTNFLQGEIKGKYIFSPFNENGRIILRSDLGYTLVNNIDQLPLTLRYFAGGITSIRGYPDSSIGPGKYLAVASAEYQHRLWDDWYGAVFYDTGTASDHYGNPPLSVGDGVGIVYQSLVGPVKLYVSRAENKRGKPFSVEFNIGPEF